MRFLIAIALALAAFSAQSETKTVTAASWAVADDKGIPIKQQNIADVRAIGSITKLMTVMVVMDAHQDLEEKIMQYTRRELIQLALVKSDNAAADQLCNHYMQGRDNCIRDMNRRAQELFMTHTKFVEPTGLSMFNVSTAEDLINLVIAASKYSVIVDAAHTSTARIYVKKKWIVFKNTNPMIGYNQNIIVSKTGYINAAGGCLVMMLDTEVGRRIVVLLGSKNTHTRIPEAEIIIRNAN